jgi:hypothetical protein
MVDTERRTIKAKRVYDDACDRSRQKDSGIKKLHQKILPKVKKLNFHYHNKKKSFFIRVN